MTMNCENRDCITPASWRVTHETGLELVACGTHLAWAVAQRDGPSMVTRFDRWDGMTEIDLKQKIVDLETMLIDACHDAVNWGGLDLEHTLNLKPHFRWYKEVIDL